MEVKIFYTVEGDTRLRIITREANDSVIMKGYKTSAFGKLKPGDQIFLFSNLCTVQGESDYLNFLTMLAKSGIEYTEEEDADGDLAVKIDNSIPALGIEKGVIFTFSSSEGHLISIFPY